MSDYCHFVAYREYKNPFLNIYIFTNFLDIKISENLYIRWTMGAKMTKSGFKTLMSELKATFLKPRQPLTEACFFVTKL